MPPFYLAPQLSVELWSWCVIMVDSVFIREEWVKLTVRQLFRRSVCKWKLCCRGGADWFFAFNDEINLDLWKSRRKLYNIQPYNLCIVLITRCITILVSLNKQLDRWDWKYVGHGEQEMGLVQLVCKIGWKIWKWVGLGLQLCWTE
jgi:hypothetical protein